MFDMCILNTTNHLIKLNTFHFAGIGAARVATATGIPRLKQLLNASISNDISNMKVYTKPLAPEPVFVHSLFKDWVMGVSYLCCNEDHNRSSSWYSLVAVFQQEDNDHDNTATATDHHGWVAHVRMDTQKMGVPMCDVVHESHLPPTYQVCQGKHTLPSRTYRRRCRDIYILPIYHERRPR